MATWEELKEKYTWGQLKQFTYRQLLNSSIDDLKKMEAVHISEELDKELQRLEEIGQSYVGQYNLTIEDADSSKLKTDSMNTLDRVEKLLSIINSSLSIGSHLVSSDFVKNVYGFIIKVISENS